jgi:transketolase
VIYDNNQITCDGSVDLTNTEDVNKKMEACGWDIIDVEDGVNDVDAIVSAMEKGRDPNRSKPLFINIRSITGVGSAKAGQAVSHGAPLGTDNVIEMKKAYGWDTTKKIPHPRESQRVLRRHPSQRRSLGVRMERSRRAVQQRTPDTRGRVSGSSRRQDPRRLDETDPEELPYGRYADAQEQQPCYERRDRADQHFHGGDRGSHAFGQSNVQRLRDLQLAGSRAYQ